MKYSIHFSIFLLSFFTLSCNGNKSSQDQPIDIKVTPEIAHIGPDSLIAHNLHLKQDSSEVLVAMSIPYERRVEGDESGICLSPKKITGKSYKIKFKEKINGYNLTVTVYPKDTIVIEDFHFSSEKANFRIQRYSHPLETLYSELFPHDPEYEYSHIYHAIPDSLFVQEDSPTIKDALFCFKDVDFDGNKELCLRQEGFNRHYFSIIKIINGKPYLLYARPYNNIVYTDIPKHVMANTVFDYKNKTITVEEQMGNVAVWKNHYKAKDTLTNPFSPMMHLWGTQTDFTSYGNDVTYFENGQISGKEIDYKLTEEGCFLIAKYKTSEAENIIRLDSLIFAVAEKRETLFPE